jgi:hypothetical protein
VKAFPGNATLRRRITTKRIEKGFAVNPKSGFLSHNQYLISVELEDNITFPKSEVYSIACCFRSGAHSSSGIIGFDGA